MVFNNQKSINDLWLQFVHGDEEVFSQLYCILYEDLLSYGQRVGGDHETVEDFIQDLFIKLYQRTIVLEDNTKLRPFLFRSLKNMIYNQLTHDAKILLMPDNELPFDLSYTIDESLFLKHDQGLSDEIHKLLSGITERQKELIYLRFVHEMSFEEIADIMEIHIQSARNLLSRSMEKIRKGTSSAAFFLSILLSS